MNFYDNGPSGPSRRAALEAYGDFVPPVIGGTSRPIRLAGRGSLQVAEGKVVAYAFASSGHHMAPAYFVLISVMLAIASGFWIGELNFEGAGRWRVLALAAAPALLVSLSGQHSVQTEEPYELNLEAGDIKSVCIKDGTIVMQVASRKLNGTLHFRPRQNLFEVHCQLLSLLRESV